MEAREKIVKREELDGFVCLSKSHKLKWLPNPRSKSSPGVLTLWIIKIYWWVVCELNAVSWEPPFYKCYPQFSPLCFDLDIDVQDILCFEIQNSKIANIQPSSHIWLPLKAYLEQLCAQFAHLKRFPANVQYTLTPFNL